MQPYHTSVHGSLGIFHPNLAWLHLLVGGLFAIHSTLSLAEGRHWLVCRWKREGGLRVLHWVNTSWEAVHQAGLCCLLKLGLGLVSPLSLSPVSSLSLSPHLLFYIGFWIHSGLKHLCEVADAWLFWKMLRWFRGTNWKSCQPWLTSSSSSAAGFIHYAWENAGWELLNLFFNNSFFFFPGLYVDNNW